MENQEKPLLRPFEKLFLFTAIVLIAALFLQQKTGKVWQTTETEVFTPGLAPSAFAAIEKAETQRLESLAEAFSSPDFGKKEAAFWAKSPLPEAEKGFFKSLRERQNELFKNQKAERGDWLDALRAAQKTYRKVSDALEVARLSPKKDSAAATEKAFSDFEKTFGVPAAASRAFGLAKPRTAADWVLFFEKKMELTR